MSLPPEKISAIKSAIDKALDQGVPPFAAVDADGTLWSCDMGEALFQYQIDKKLLPELPENPWDHYLKLHRETTPQESFLWLAQINAGLTLDQVRQWATEATQALEPLPLFSGHQEIIAYLHEKGVKVYVVTASVKWAVEPAAKFYDIPEDRVIGVSTKIVDGRITMEQEGPITYRKGKVEGFLEASQGQPAFYVAGNTGGDLPLLESSTHVRLVLNSAPKGHGNYQTEMEMQKLAQQNGWFHHSFL